MSANEQPQDSPTAEVLLDLLDWIRSRTTGLADEQPESDNHRPPPAA